MLQIRATALPYLDRIFISSIFLNILMIASVSFYDFSSYFLLSKKTTNGLGDICKQI